MPLRVGLLSCAHLHVGSYVHALNLREDAEIVGLWDDDQERGKAFAQGNSLAFEPDLDALLDRCDAVVITSENTKHADLGIRSANKGKHILCEKPLVTNVEDGERFLEAVRRNHVRLMTAFPCRFSPAFQRIKERVAAGDIGAVRGICATNRGSCPKGWFVEKDKSGGGAMIDHVVHVADLLRDLLGEEPATVQAQIGSNMYGQEWDDTAMLTLEYPSGVFASLDSSWSRPASYKTWGDVTMNVVGDTGVIELDMFGPAVEHFHEGPVTHTVGAYGSNLDALLVDEFVKACLENREPRVTGQDGLAAAKVAIAGYKSVQTGEPVSL